MLATVACREGTEKTAIELVPNDVNLVANIQISRILDDQDLRRAYDQAEKEPGQPQTMEDALNEFVEEIGIDLRSFSQATLFADTSRSRQNNYLGVLIEGRIDQEQFLLKVEEKTQERLESSEYQGNQLFVHLREDIAVTFLSDRMLAVGSLQAVKDVIDVREGNRRQLTGLILDTYNRLGEPLMKVSLEFPEQMRTEIAEEPLPGGIPISPKAFAEMDAAGFSLDKQADLVAARMDAHFMNAGAAQDARDTLTGAIMLVKGMVEIPEMKQVLGKIEVTSTDSWVEIMLDVSISELEGFVEAVKKTVD